MFTIGRLDIGIRTRGAGTPPVPAAPVSSSAPAITGSPLVGTSLSCSTGGWTGFPAPTFTYQWIWADTSANISGATSSTYTPVSGDLGHTLKCAVTATNSQGNATANSNTTAAVAALPVNTVAPAVTGSTNVGQTLSTTNGTWSNTPTSYAYQWKWADTGASISGATASTYVLVSGDVGHTIKCTVTATNAAGSTSADSNTTGVVTAGVAPVFQADFTSLSALPTGISFSRASNAMVTDSTGKLTYAPNNLITYSNSFDQWTSSNITLTTGQADPDGGTSAATLSATATSSGCYIVTSPVSNAISGSVIVSVVAKAGTSNWLSFSNTAVFTYFNLGTGAVGSIGEGTAGIVSLGSGWYRCWWRMGITNAPAWRIRVATADGDFSVTAGANVIIYKATYSNVTYETAPRSLDQVSTITAAYYGPRSDFAWNGSAWAAVGLLIEEQRTNICQTSADLSTLSWSLVNVTRASGITDLSGGTAGVTVTASAGAGVHCLRSDSVSSVASGSTVTATVYIKQGTAPYTVFGDSFGSNYLWGSIKWSDLSLQTSGTDSATITKRDCGNGVYAVSITWIRDATNIIRLQVGPNNNSAATIGNNDISYTAVGTETAIVLGSQIELGPFATSFILTTTAAVTRSADIATLGGAADTAAKSASGTFLVEVSELQLAAPSVNQVILSSANHFPIFRDHSTDKPELYSYHDGASIGVFADAVSGGWGVPNRIGVAHDATSVSFVANGTTVATGTGTEDWASDGTIWLGSFNGTQAINGHVRSIAIYSSRLSDTDLQTKSVVGAAF